jgi:hypothetical protein
MNCSTCGVELVPGALFCPNCGARVTAPSNAGAPTTGLPPTYDSPPQPPPLRDIPPAPVAPQWVTPGASPYGPASPPNSTAALVSLIFGILSWVLLPVIGPIVAVVAGHMARAEIRSSNGQVGGGGMALAGLVLGYLQIALIVLGICAIATIVILAALGARTSP